MKFDFTPIEEHVRQRRPDITSESGIAQYLGCDRKSLIRYRKGGIDAYAVDRICTKQLGVWPGILYPDFTSARRVVGEHLARRQSRGRKVAA